MKKDCKKCPCPLILECGQRPLYEEALKQRDDILGKLERLIENYKKDPHGIYWITARLETIVKEAKK